MVVGFLGGAIGGGAIGNKGGSKFSGVCGIGGNNPGSPGGDTATCGVVVGVVVADPPGFSKTGGGRFGVSLSFSSGI